MYSKHADQRMDTYLMESDVLRQRADARMLMGSGFLDEFAPALCMHNAAQPKIEKTLALAVDARLGLD